MNVIALDVKHQNKQHLFQRKMYKYTFQAKVLQVDHVHTVVVIN